MLGADTVVKQHDYVGMRMGESDFAIANEFFGFFPTVHFLLEFGNNFSGGFVLEKLDLSKPRALQPCLKLEVLFNFAFFLEIGWVHRSEFNRENLFHFHYYLSLDNIYGEELVNTLLFPRVALLLSC